MIIQDNNAYAAKNQDGARKPWQDMPIKDLYSYLSVVIYMGLVKVMNGSGMDPDSIE